MTTIYVTDADLAALKQSPAHEGQLQGEPDVQPPSHPIAVDLEALKQSPAHEQQLQGEADVQPPSDPIPGII